MGAIEPVQETAAHELGLLVDVIGDTEEISKAVCAKMRYILLHGDFEGRMCISGNMAIPFSPSDMPVGPVYEFSVWHVMECDHPLEAVRMEMGALMATLQEMAKVIRSKTPGRCNSRSI